MKHLLKITLDDEQVIYIEVSDTDFALDDSFGETYQEGITQTGARARLDDITEKAIEITSVSLEKLTSTLVSFSSQFYKKFSELPQQNRPDKIQIEYSVEITSGADIKIANSSGKGAIKVVAEWKKG